MINIFKFIMEVLSMEVTRRKHKLSASMQIYIEVWALKISLKEKTINDTPNHKILRSLILEDCEKDYSCDGFGEPLKPNVEVGA